MYRAFVRAKSGCDKWHDYEMAVAPYENDKPIYYEFTACPAAEFANRYGLTDIMPALCNVDYASMELLHARLVRTTTCVDGCRCDYTICGDKDPYLKEHPEYRDENGYRRNQVMLLQVILEGLGLGVLLVLVCAVGIRKGAVGMVHLYPMGQPFAGLQPGLYAGLQRFERPFRQRLFPFPRKGRGQRDENADREDRIWRESNETPAL